MKLGSNITWFDEDDYIGAAISFPSGSVWRLETKAREHEYYETKTDIEELDIRSEARAVFFCSKLTGYGPSNAVIKMRLQIPWAGTATKRTSIRAQQATLGPAPNFQTEIDALSALTKAHCSSTPSLFDWKREQQSEDGLVPGGYKLCILMEQLPGSDPSNSFINRRMDRAERDALRAAFKTAWLEILDCGLRHRDPALRNLLWDKGANKCYLIDWEYCCAREETDNWTDLIYLEWNLARTGRSRNSKDMREWDL